MHLPHKTFYDLCTIIAFTHFTTYGAARPANAPEMPIIRALPKENLPYTTLAKALDAIQRKRLSRVPGMNSAGNGNQTLEAEVPMAEK